MMHATEKAHRATQRGLCRHTDPGSRETIEVPLPRPVKSTWISSHRGWSSPTEAKRGTDERTGASQPVHSDPDRWLLDDHPGDANRQRWLPPGGAAPAAPEPESVAAEPKPDRLVRKAGPTTAAAGRHPEQAAAPEPDPEREVFAGSSRRRRAVEAYCAELCLPEQASAAATETLGSFVDGDDHHLLRVMRVLAAKHVDTLPDHRRGWPAQAVGAARGRMQPHSVHARRAGQRRAERGRESQAR